MCFRSRVYVSNGNLTQANFIEESVDIRFDGADNRGMTNSPITMLVRVIVRGIVEAEFEAVDFDSCGSTPDHFDKIAPAYLAPLTRGEPCVTVEYRSPRNGTLAEIHTPAGWRDGRVVGTKIEYVD